MAAARKISHSPAPMHEFAIGPRANELEVAVTRMAQLAGGEQRFCVLLVMCGVDCQRLTRRLRATIRAPLGARATFGTWCAGVAIVFEPPEQQAAAHIVLRALPTILGVEVTVHRDRGAAVHWLSE